MALSSEDTFVSPPTAPVEEMPTAGLPEEPATSDAELRSAADALARSLRQEPPETGEENLARYLEGLRSRLNESVLQWKARVLNRELTPQLELVENVRMFEAAVPRAESGQEMFRDVPFANLPPAGSLPQVVHIAGSYLVCVDGIWSKRSLRVFIEQIQKHEPLALREIQLLPDALRLAQLEFILNSADEAFAAGELPPIEESPFSAPIHSLRRLNQTEWRDVLEPLMAFDAVLRQDPVGAYAAMPKGRSWPRKGRPPIRVRYGRAIYPREGETHQQLSLRMQQGVAELFAAADAAVLPRADGGTSGALVLALSHGVPVVASDLPVYSELVSAAGAGWLFEPGDRAALSAALEDVAAEPVERLSQRADAARARAKALDWKDSCRAYARLLRELER